MAPTAVFVRRAEADSASAASPATGETVSAENQVCKTGRKVGWCGGCPRRERRVEEGVRCRFCSGASLLESRVRALAGNTAV